MWPGGAERGVSTIPLAGCFAICMLVGGISMWNTGDRQGAGIGLELSRDWTGAQVTESLEEDRTSLEEDKQTEKILKRAQKEKDKAHVEDQMGTTLDTKADRICKMAKHLEDTDSGEAQRARAQKEAATSLEGRAAVLIGQAAREEETYKQIHAQGELLRSKGKKLLERGSAIFEQAAAINTTANPHSLKNKDDLIAQGHVHEDHGGRLIASAHEILSRASQHKANAGAIRAQAVKTSLAAKATMELGRRFAREAVQHELKSMTYRSKCTMMRAKAQAALRRAKDEARNAQDLKHIANDATQTQTHPAASSTSLLQTTAITYSSKALNEGGSYARMPHGDASPYEAQQRFQAWRQRSMRERLRRALAKTSSKRAREEASIRALDVAIRKDRHDYAAARNQEREALRKQQYASEEMQHLAQLRAEQQAKKTAYNSQKMVTETLREKVSSMVAAARGRHNRNAEERKQSDAAEQTLMQVEAQANEERNHAMELEEDAQEELGGSHALSLRASHLQALASQLDATAEQDMEAARNALLAGRAAAEKRLKAIRDAEKGIVGGGVAAKEQQKASAGAEARRDAALMRAKEKQAASLRQEATGFRHSATELSIQAEIAGARAPHDLAAAQKELAASDMLVEHVQDLRRALQKGRVPNGGPSTYTWGVQTQGVPIGLLARYTLQEKQDKNVYFEALERANEIQSKAEADSKQARAEMSEALTTVKAAQTSEDEDEVRRMALERRLRMTQEQEDSIKASIGA